MSGGRIPPSHRCLPVDYVHAAWCEECGHTVWMRHDNRHIFDLQKHRRECLKGAGGWNHKWRHVKILNEDAEFLREEYITS